MLCYWWTSRKSEADQSLSAASTTTCTCSTCTCLSQWLVRLIIAGTWDDYTLGVIQQYVIAHSTMHLPVQKLCAFQPLPNYTCYYMTYDVWHASSINCSRLLLWPSNTHMYTCIITLEPQLITWHTRAPAHMTSSSRSNIGFHRSNLEFLSLYIGLATNDAKAMTQRLQMARSLPSATGSWGGGCKNMRGT